MRTIRWLPVLDGHGHPERGLFQLAYLRPKGKLEKRGFYFRYKPWGRTVYKGPYPSPAAARKARAAAVAQYEQQKAGTMTVEPTRKTVDVLVTEYLAEQDGQVDEYRAQARYGAFWAHRFKGRPVLSLEPAEVRQARAYLKSRKGRKGARELADSTANHYVKFLRTMMKRMVKPRAWVIEFWSEVPIPRALPARIRPVYTEAQMDRLYAKLRPFDILFSRLAYLWGLRGGQMVLNRWEETQWAEHIQTIPKFKKHPAREIPIEAEAERILRFFWEQQGRPDRGWLFPAPTDPALHLDYHNWYNRHFLKALKASGLSKLGLDFHALRHTWATRLGGKTPTRVLQLLGGWSDLKQVERYAKPMVGAMRQAMREASRFGSKGAKQVLTGILKATQKKRPSPRKSRPMAV